MAHLLAFADHLLDFAAPFILALLGAVLLGLWIFLWRTAPWNR